MRIDAIYALMPLGILFCEGCEEISGICETDLIGAIVHLVNVSADVVWLDPDVDDPVDCTHAQASALRPSHRCSHERPRPPVLPIVEISPRFRLGRKSCTSNVE